MSSPPDLPAFCLSDMAVRVDDTIQTTLLGIERALSLFGGTVAERLPYTLTMVCGGVEVQVAAFRVLGADYLEVGTKDGDSFQRPSSVNWAPCPPSAATKKTAVAQAPPPGLSLAKRTPVAKPQRKYQQPPKTAPPPPPPRSKPTSDPLEVPPLSLDAQKVEDAWAAVDGIAAWPRAELQDFAAAHQDICFLYSRGALEPHAFEQHMQRLPPLVRKGLKWFSRRWNILPPNVANLLDQVSMICAEGEVFWALHGS